MSKNGICFAANSLVCRMYRPGYAKFHDLMCRDRRGSRPFEQVGKIQEQKLLGILRSNASCRFGRRYQFDRLKSVREFQQTVPLAQYEDYERDIENIHHGADSILTDEKVDFLEPSSGSASASKLIPYTRGLQKEFQAGIRPWIYDLYTKVPLLKWGRSYWSVTPPVTRRPEGSEKIPVGFEDDKAYFGRIENLFFNTIFAVPGSVAREKTINDFYWKTSLALLNCKSLSLISVWNPSYLLILLQFMERNVNDLTAGIKGGEKRAAEIRSMLADRAYTSLWKELKVISCWADAGARIYAARLIEMFPSVLIQPKGLLSTEGFVSFPLIGIPHPVLSVYSHFFEFASMNDQGIYLAGELQVGGEYAVILTTSGGLYRYQLKDVIRVKGFAGEVPMIEFVGKQDAVSDLHGEKLNGVFVEKVLAKLLQGVDFSMLAPETDHYVLYVHFASVSDRYNNVTHDRLPQRLETELLSNFHYDHCRRLGQLKPVKVFLLDHNPGKEYIEECVRRGQRLGNIKPVSLHLTGGWQNVFSGKYV